MGATALDPRLTDGDTPRALAWRMSSYRKDAKYIQAMVRRDYGKAPTIAQIEDMIQMRQRAAEFAEREHYTPGYNPDNDNGEPFRVRGLVKGVARPAYGEKREPLTEEELVALGGGVVGPSKKILAAVGKWFNLDPDTIRSDCRKQFVVSARYVAIRLIYELVDGDGERRFTNAMIARATGRGDHSTISHAIAYFDYRAKKFPEMLEAYEALKDG